jgi:DNA helicase II / ATP-dependent DNA helicase PcrA
MMEKMENDTPVSLPLNDIQQRAVTHREGPLLVLAGAGSGKTRIVTCRIAHLIESGVCPSKILAVTFTNKAAGEMQERINTLLAGKSLFERPTICTFHSLGVKILRESISLLGYTPAFVIYDREDSDKLLSACLKSLGLHKENIAKTFIHLISHVKNQLVNPESIEESHASLKESFCKVYSLYQERLKSANALDFDDLLFLTVKLFQEYKNVLEHYQNKWSYLLIDEYQDTNHAQYLIAAFIAKHTGNIFAVGDPDQSIYSWRGANLKNILNFEKDYPGAKKIALEQNYRSTEIILNAANQLIRHNSRRYEKNLWSKLGTGEKISLYVAASEREEAEFVVDEIDYLTRKLKFSRREITIFYRTNFQSRIFEDYLLRKKMPYVIVGGISFYQRKEIKDILAFLHLLVTPSDFISFVRTINLPRRGIGEVAIEKIRQGASDHGMPIIEFCRKMVGSDERLISLNAKQKQSLKEYLTILDELKIQEEKSLSNLISQTVKITNYLQILKEDEETFEDRKANIDELISKAAEWELVTESSCLVDFLEELSLKTHLDHFHAEEEKINLMTLHNGKGLEFDAIFLVGMEEDLFPHANSRESFESLEEERRLCYVGMTRAKKRLYLSAAETRFIWGSWRKMRPSRFLREIPREYIDRLQ